MRYALVALFLTAQTYVIGQDLLSVPPDTLTPRLTLAGAEMHKASVCRETGLWWLVFGTVFTVLSSDHSHRVYNERIAVGFGMATLGGFVTFHLFGAKHERRAAAHLRGQKL